MPRPKSRRFVQHNPKTTYYKPRGIPMNSLQEIELTHEEWEALRLKNVENLNQGQAAAKMETSQSTFQRILTSAYKKMSTALVKGMAIKIQNQ